MSFLFIVNINITDECMYDKYLEKCDAVFSNFKGTYRVVTDSPEIIEGHWPYRRLVVIEFQCREDFDEWYNSAEYQSILKFRLNGATCASMLVEL